MLVEKFVQDLDDNTRLSILEDYEKFRRDGVIGDCILRRTTEQLMSSLHSNEHVVFWMEHLASECYRYYGQKYIEELFNIQLPA
jgi:hypothetical protein